MGKRKDNEITVVITGANNGIGYYMSETLLQNHYSVAALDIEIDRLEELKKSYPDKLLVIKSDVTSDNQVEDAVQEILNIWNRIDILVNNACLVLFSPFEKKSLSEIKREMEVNFFGYVRMIRAVLPVMKEQGYGTIHNISSGVGITGFPGLSGYTSSKGALEALSRTLSYELEESGITVHTMHPPLTNTKSAAPLGIPGEMMESPKKVGRLLAGKIQSKKTVITPNWMTTIYLFFARRFPHSIGRLMGKMAQKERANL